EWGVHRITNRLGVVHAGRRPRTRGGDAARRGMVGRPTARGRHLGRAAVHRHGFPRALLHQLPLVPLGAPTQCARKVSGGQTCRIGIVTGYSWSPRGGSRPVRCGPVCTPTAWCTRDRGRGTGYGCTPRHATQTVRW